MPELNARAAEITATENTKLWERTTGSKSLYARALKHMPQGVPSSFQAWEPYPVYLREGKGSRVWDVDGKEDLPNAVATTSLPNGAEMSVPS